MLCEGFHAVPAGHVATIVTHLEMTAPPAGMAGREFPDGVSLMDVTDPDLDTYRDLFRRVGGMPWLWWTRLTKSDADLAAVLGHKDTALTYLVKDGQPEGLLELDYRNPDFCEIAYFGLTDTLIGTGAGGALMRTAIIRAFAAGSKRLYLHTCTLDSPQALDFYRHMGFTPFRQEVEIAVDPRLQGTLPRSAGPRTPIYDP